MEDLKVNGAVGEDEGGQRERVLIIVLGRWPIVKRQRIHPRYTQLT